MPRRIKMITGAVSKSIRRQKNKDYHQLVNLFKDGATKFGRKE